MLDLALQSFECAIDEKTNQAKDGFPPEANAQPNLGQGRKNGRIALLFESDKLCSRIESTISNVINGFRNADAFEIFAECKRRGFNTFKALGQFNLSELTVIKESVGFDALDILRKGYLFAAGRTKK